MSLTCAFCGLTYMPDEPADLAQHADRHARILAAKEPLPDTNFIRELERTGGRPVFVCCVSPDWMHEETHNRSMAFANEVPSGVTAWPLNGRSMPITCQCYLLADDTETLPAGAIAGACGFREVEYTDAPKGWRLEWIWLCPAVRRKGILHRQWDWFRERYGAFDFWAGTEAMKGFARKHRQPD